MTAILRLDTIAACRAWRRTQSAPVAFVPTMGALHEGHASLVKAARLHAGNSGVVLASIFVNPTQFAPREDFSRYPRTLDADLALLARDGCDAVFLPAADEMYPAGTQLSALSTSIDPGPLGSILEGAIRPGHFRGVCTVVAKLLNIATPTHMFMGQKDFQQQLILRHMLRDLNMPVDLITCPTIREPDGLAMSSRNRYLSPDERARAVAISEALRQGIQQAHAGESPSDIETAMALHISARGLKLDYVAVAHSQTLAPLHAIIPGQTVLLAAARNGATRLIDNMPV